jgi:TonB family protein
MALLHLIDRPDDATLAPRRHGLTAAASACSHVLVAAGLLIGLREAAPRAITNRLAFDARMVWIPNVIDGGGRETGGDRSTTARPARNRGPQDKSMLATTQPSTTSLADMTIEPINVSAVPMSGANQMLPGAVTSDRPGAGVGANLGPGGDGHAQAGGPGNGSSTGVGDGVHSVGPGVTTPIPIHQVKPQYTENAMRAKVQGMVTLQCVVLPDGTVGDVRIVRSLDRSFELDEAAIAAAKQWRFKPGLMNGHAVAVAVNIELTFTLR